LGVNFAHRGWLARLPIWRGRIRFRRRCHRRFALCRLSDRGLCGATLARATTAAAPAATAPPPATSAALGTVGALRAIRARLARCGRGGRRSAGVRAHRSVRRLLSGFAAVGDAALAEALGSATRVAITITVPAVTAAIPIAAIATAAVTTIAPRAIGVARMARMLSAAVAAGPTIAARS